MLKNGLLVPEIGQVVLDRAVNIGHISYLYTFVITTKYTNNIKFVPHNLPNEETFFPADELIGNALDYSPYTGLPVWLAAIHQKALLHTQHAVGYCTGTEPIFSCCGALGMVDLSQYGPYPIECYPYLTYKPWPCKHESIREAVDDATAEVSFAATPMWMDLLLGSMNVDVEVRICRFRWETHDVYMLYSGKMDSFSFNSGVFTLKCSATWNSGEADVPLYYTQRHCNHTPFSSMCGLYPGKFMLTIPAGQWYVHERQNIILSEAYNLDSEYWKECIALYPVFYTDIVEMPSGKTKEVKYAFTGDNIAVYVKGRSLSFKNTISCYADTEKSPLVLIPNCCLNLQRCRDIFGNLRRATAWPDMPLKNYAALDVETTGKGTGRPHARPPAGE